MTAASSPRCRLTYVIRGERQQVVLQGPRVLVGRSSRCDLTLADESISRNHAELLLGADGWTLRDLDSRNGIEVNGRRVSQRALRDGDQLRIGSVALQCEITGAPSAAPGVVIDETKAEPPPRAVIEMDTMLPLLTQAAVPAAAPPAKGAGGKVRPPPIESEASKQLRTRLGVAAPLREAAEALLGATDLGSVLERFLQIVAGHLRAQRGFVGLKDERTGELVAKASWSHKKEQTGPIVISRHIADAAMNAHQSILVGDAEDDSRFGAVESIRQMQIRSAMCAPLLRNGQVGGLIYLDTLSLAMPFQKEDLEVLAVFATLAAVAVEETTLRDTVAREQKIRERLARYSSVSVVNHIVGQHKAGEAAPAVDVGMRSMEREISVLFCDFAGFTGFAETLAPAEVTRVLNRAFERLTAAVFAEEGTLDKFTGDGMMVFFGAPLDQPDHALRAVRTAVRMQRALSEPVAEGVQPPPLALRIGVNSGVAIVGDIGTPTRSDYTAIGATVNTAIRLESTVAKPGQIVVGPATYEAVKGQFHCQPLPEQLLRGMTMPIQPYLVLGDRATPAEGGSSTAEKSAGGSAAPDSVTPTPVPPAK